MLRSRTPKIILKYMNSHTSYLMENEPFHNFELKYKLGIKLTYQVSSSVCTLYDPKSKVKKQINPYQDYEYLNLEEQRSVDQMFNDLKKSLEIERKYEAEENYAGGYPIIVQGANTH